MPRRHIIPEDAVETVEERRLLEQAFHSLDQFNRILVVKRQELIEALARKPIPDLDGRLVRVVMTQSGRNATYAVAKITPRLACDVASGTWKVTVEFRLGVGKLLPLSLSLSLSLSLRF